MAEGDRSIKIAVALAGRVGASPSSRCPPTYNWIRVESGGEAVMRIRHIIGVPAALAALLASTTLVGNVASSINAS
jgi:hypothetical protein